MHCRMMMHGMDSSAVQCSMRAHTQQPPMVWVCLLAYASAHARDMRCDVQHVQPRIDARRLPVWRRGAPPLDATARLVAVELRQQALQQQLEALGRQLDKQQARVRQRREDGWVGAGVRARYEWE